MKIHLLTGLLLATLLLMGGCKEPVASNPGGSPAKSAPDNAGGDAGSQTDNFVVKKPDSFAGEFNPDGKQVGLKVGMLAKEIVGKDLDGNEFKLSDYRGKVVMLDFWGRLVTTLPCNVRT